MNVVSYLPRCINPFALHDENKTPSLDTEIRVEQGSPRPVVDTIRNVLSIPMKLIMGNMEYNEGVSDEVIGEAKQFLSENSLGEVSISANQYKPQEMWRRIFTNPKTSLLSKCTLGVVEGLIETLTVPRLTGALGDHYRPQANTVYLSSNDSALALIPCAEALKYNSKYNPSLYSIFIEYVPALISSNPVVKELISCGLKLDKLSNAEEYFRLDGRLDKCMEVAYAGLSLLAIKVFSLHPASLLLNGDYKKLGMVIIIANLAHRALSFIGQYLTQDNTVSFYTSARERCKSLLIGLGVGAVDFCVSIANITALFYVLNHYGLLNVGRDAKVASDYSKSVSSSLFDTAIVAPFLEEVIFRVSFQDIASRILGKILPDREIKLPFFKTKLTTIASIALASVAFGAAHLTNKTGLVQPLNCIFSGIVLGTIYHNYGFLSSFAAHATNNAITVAVSRLGK